MSSDNHTYRFLLSGGGTGGHIFPALSIAKELKRRFPDAQIQFVGSLGRMEMEKVPAHGFPITGLPIAGLQRKLSLRNLALPFKVLSSILKSYALLRKFRPHAVIGTGGYASLPLLWTAQRMGIPTYIQEQNSFPGITNKLLGKKAKLIFTAYDEARRFFPASRIRLTGNPVRPELTGIPAPGPGDFRDFGLQNDRFTVLVLGGSLGSAVINRQVAEWVRKGLPADMQLLWQTGKLYYERYKDLESDRVRIIPFITDMRKAFSLADAIISRAGAGTLSELALAGKPVILIPSPNVAEDHQTKNARAFSDREAAILLPETQIHRMSQTVRTLQTDENLRRKLSENIRRLARPDATARITDEILKDLNLS